MYTVGCVIMRYVYPLLLLNVYRYLLSFSLHIFLFRYFFFPFSSVLRRFYILSLPKVMAGLYSAQTFPSVSIVLWFMFASNRFRYSCHSIRAFLLFTFLSVCIWVLVFHLSLHCLISLYSIGFCLSINSLLSEVWTTALCLVCFVITIVNRLWA